MTRDDIICMAREAGARTQQEKNCDVEYLFSFEQLERLLAAENEACAKVCENMDWCYDDRKDFAAAIRARRNT